MTYEFIRIPFKGVFNQTKGKRSTEFMVKKLHKLGFEVTYKCEKTGQNLLPELLNQPTNTEALGPARPLYKAKKYKCQGCGARTVNRFRCPTCWNDYYRFDYKDLSEDV